MSSFDYLLGTHINLLRHRRAVIASSRARKTQKNVKKYFCLFASFNGVKFSLNIFVIELFDLIFLIKIVCVILYLHFVMVKELEFCDWSR